MSIAGDTLLLDKAQKQDELLIWSSVEEENRLVDHFHDAVTAIYFAY